MSGEREPTVVRGDRKVVSIPEVEYSREDFEARVRGFTGAKDAEWLVLRAAAYANEVSAGSEVYFCTFLLELERLRAEYPCCDV